MPLPSCGRSATQGWLPKPPPLALIHYVEIADSPAGWRGHCLAPDIYCTRWSSERISERYRPLMEAQVVIHLAGGIGEAILRGERSGRDFFWIWSKEL